jgi:hypothetical protein
VPRGTGWPFTVAWPLGVALLWAWGRRPARTDGARPDGARPDGARPVSA